MELGFLITHHVCDLFSTSLRSMDTTFHDTFHTADTLIHHIHAFTIHVTALILLKGVLFARGSRLIADKALLGFRFP